MDIKVLLSVLSVVLSVFTIVQRYREKKRKAFGKAKVTFSFGGVIKKDEIRDSISWPLWNSVYGISGFNSKSCVILIPYFIRNHTDQPLTDVTVDLIYPRRYACHYADEPSIVEFFSKREKTVDGVSRRIVNHGNDQVRAIRNIRLVYPNFTHYFCEPILVRREDIENGVGLDLNIFKETKKGFKFNINARAVFTVRGAIEFQHDVIVTHAEELEELSQRYTKPLERLMELTEENPFKKLIPGKHAWIDGTTLLVYKEKFMKYSSMGSLIRLGEPTEPDVKKFSIEMADSTKRAYGDMTILLPYVPKGRLKDTDRMLIALLFVLFVLIGF